MTRLTLTTIACLLLAAGLSACSGSGGGTLTDGSILCTTRPKNTNPFIAMKVQINGGVSALGTTGSGKAIPKGTKLVALKKESCIADGRVTKSGVRSVPYVAPADMTLDELSAQAEQDACIIGISDHIDMFPSDAYTDPDVPHETHLAAIEQPAANVIFRDPAQGITKDAVIAVIDTGVDVTHEDLKDNAWVNPGEIPGNGVDDDNNGYIDDVNGWNFADDDNQVTPQCGSGCNHGTHVAGLAAAKGGNGIGIAGVMGEHVKIMALNVFGNSFSADNGNIANAIRYAADNGADVINMSLGGGGSDTGTQAALQYALSKNVTVVVAAGNASSIVDMGANFENPASYSGMFKGVIAVGSVDTNNFALSYFSDFGTGTVKIAAPGSDSMNKGGLLSTIPGNQYGRMQGTSMASPVTAGAAALVAGYMRSHGVTPTPAAVEYALTTTARPINGLMGSIQGGRVLDLKNLALFLNSNLGNLDCH